MKKVFLILLAVYSTTHTSDDYGDLAVYTVLSGSFGEFAISKFRQYRSWDKIIKATPIVDPLLQLAQKQKNRAAAIGLLCAGAGAYFLLPAGQTIHNKFFSDTTLKNSGTELKKKNEQ